MLPAHLTALEASGLLRVAPDYVELEYLFRHALIQDAAYNSLLKADRRALHQRVGETLEALYAAQLGEVALVLAQHFDAAGDEARAMRYYTLAGDEAASGNANVEAAQHYESALKLAKQAAPSAENTATLKMLCLRLGRVLELKSRYPEAIAHYTAIETLARARGDLPLELAALTEHAKIRTTANPFHDIPLGKALLERARHIAHELGDREAEARLLWNLMLLYTLTGSEVERRAEYGEQALALARALNLREQLAFILHDLWYAYGGFQGDKVQRVLHEASQLWRELNNTPMLAECLMRLSIQSSLRGQVEQAATLGQEAVALARSCHNQDSQVNNQAMLGLIYQEWGQIETALTLWEEAVTTGQPLGNVTSQINAQSELGWLYGQLGARTLAYEKVHAALAFAHERFPLLAAWAQVALARVQLDEGETAEAEAQLMGLDYQALKGVLNFIPHICIDLALAQSELALQRGDRVGALPPLETVITDFTQAGLQFRLSAAFRQKSRALSALGRLEEAYVALTTARDYAEQSEARWALWQILNDLGELEAQRGQPQRAQACWEQARGLVQGLLDQLAQRPALRASFLATPAVAKLLSRFTPNSLLI